MKVKIGDQIRIKHVLTDHGRYWMIEGGERVYLKKLKSGILVPT
jgi:hypothetical protein